MFRNFKRGETIRAPFFTFLLLSPNSIIYVNSALTVKYISSLIFIRNSYIVTEKPHTNFRKKFPSSVELKLIQNKETILNTVIRKMREG
jgi:hypothetical protein